MNDLLIGYSVTLAFICVLGGLFCVYRYYLGNKLIDQANKLKTQIAKIRQDFPELDMKRHEIVADAIGDIGINGLLEQFGINPSILNNPLVKGIVEKYAPKLIENLGKSAKNESKGEGNNYL